MRISEYDDWLIQSLAEQFDCSKAEAVRNAIWTVRVLFDPKLTVEDMLKGETLDEPLADIMKPFPELASKMNLDYSLWEKYHEEEVNK